MATAAEQISQIYVGYFNRAPDPAGLQYWITQLNNGMPLGEIADYFATEQETLDLYPYLREPDLNSVDGFINEIYGNLFNRPADAAGLAFWKGQLESGAVSEGEFIAAIANGATGEGRLVLDNKVAVGVYFAAELSQNNVVWNATALDAAYQALAGVTLDPASVIEAQNEINYFVDNGAWPGAVGETFTLTAGVDTIVGTAGNDTVQGVLSTVAGTAQTLNPLDNIDGGAGDNRLVLVVNGPANALPAATTIENIQNVELIQTVGASVAGLNSGYFGEQVESVWQIANGAGSVASAITLSQNGQIAGFSGNVAGFVSPANGVHAGNGVSDVEVAFDNVGNGVIARFYEDTAGDLEVVTVSGSVAGAGSVTINTRVDTTAVETINLALTTSGQVNLIVDNAVVETVDASASTGNLTINAVALTALETFVGGAGNDVLSVTTVGRTGGDLSVNGGAGNDTINSIGNAGTANVAVSLTGGAGNDTFVFSGALTNVFDAGDVASSLISVTDFGVSDILDLRGLTANVRDTLTTTELGNIAGAATLEDALDLAGGFTAAGQFSIFNYGDSAYIFSNVNAGFQSGDGLIEIAGFSLEQFSSANLLVA